MAWVNVVTVFVMLCRAVELCSAAECEVCIGFLSRLYEGLRSQHVELTPGKVEEGLLKACGEAAGKENRLVSVNSLAQGKTHFILLSGVPSVHASIHYLQLLTQYRVSKCYYLGATSDAATKVTGEVTRPMSFHLPVDKICERLQKMDSQICELRYEKHVVDFSKESLSKLRVAELKNLLNSWGEVCRACIEKTDFVDLIQEVAPKHTAHVGQKTDL